MASSRPSTVVYIATSIDGFIARPDGGLDWLGTPSDVPDEDLLTLWADFLGSVDHMVMGRKTFEQVLEFESWSYEGTPVTVLSNSMRDVPEHLLGKADVSCLGPTGLLHHLEGLERKRIYVDGGQVIQSFLRNDLIDGMIITTIPVLLGAGIPLFGSLEADLTWEHIDTKALPGGLVQTHYRRCR